MTYSDRAYELAKELEKKATSNLQRSGRTVSRSARTGRFVVTSHLERSAASSTAVQRDK